MCYNVFMEKCNLCPRQCNITRPGFCGEGEMLSIARAALHYWEEPCISGDKGSGAVFFTGCNLKCIYCQNAAISDGGVGRKITSEELCDIFFDLKNQGANNINLVTPTHFIKQIKEAIIMAKEKGFDLPFVYNTSGYEKVESLKLLDGLIDIYLPDFKYMDVKKAKDYSNAPDYPDTAKKAIEEMVRQVGKCVTGDDGIMRKGIIVRHLVLPLGVHNAKDVIDYLYDTYGDLVYVSVMNQYTPLYDSDVLSEAQRKRLETFPELHRRTTKREYEKVVDYCIDKGMTNVFIQEGETAKESFIPAFKK